MQLLGRMMDQALAAHGRRATIVGATSGDTGAAAIEAFRGIRRRRHLHPLPARPRVRRAAPADDDRRGAQRPRDRDRGHLRRLPGDPEGAVRHPDFRERMGLSGVNSINWARVVAQIVYYFISAVALGGPHRPVSFAVPTGNFGDVLAGYVAKRMGLPVEPARRRDQRQRHPGAGAGERRLRDPRASSRRSRPRWTSRSRRISSGCCSTPTGATLARCAPSWASCRAVAGVRHRRCAAGGHPGRVRRGRGRRARHHRRRCVAPTGDSGMIARPAHGHRRRRGARRALAADPTTPMIALGTAHPAKFPDAVEAATGRRPPLPEHLADLLERRGAIHRAAQRPAAVERPSFAARARASRDGSAEAAA